MLLQTSPSNELLFRRDEFWDDPPRSPEDVPRFRCQLLRDSRELAMLDPAVIDESDAFIFSAIPVSVTFSSVDDMLQLEVATLLPKYL
jgi:hypothetical protein